MSENAQSKKPKGKAPKKPSSSGGKSSTLQPPDSLNADKPEVSA